MSAGVLRGVTVQLTTWSRTVRHLVESRFRALARVLLVGIVHGQPSRPSPGCTSTRRMGSVLIDRGDTSVAQLPVPGTSPSHDQR